MSDCHDQQTTVASAEEVQLIVASLESSQPQQLWGQTWSLASPQLHHWQSLADEDVQVIPCLVRVAAEVPSVAVVSVVVAAVVASTASAVETGGSAAASCSLAASVGSSSAS